MGGVFHDKSLWNRNEKNVKYTNPGDSKNLFG